MNVTINEFYGTVLILMIPIIQILNEYYEIYGTPCLNINENFLGKNINTFKCINEVNGMGI